MIKYKSSPTEYQLLKCESLILTTENLVWERSKILSKELIICPLREIKVFDGKVQAFMGGYQDERKLEVHFINGEAEQFWVCDEDPLDREQQLEVIKWLKALNSAIVGAEGDYEEIESSLLTERSGAKSPFKAVAKSAGTGRELGQDIASAALGGGIVGDIVGGTVGGIAGGVFGLIKKSKAQNDSSAAIAQSPATNEKLSTKCSNCGAPILGRKGQIIRCQYCDTDQQL